MIITYKSAECSIFWNLITHTSYCLSLGFCIFNTKFKKVRLFLFSPSIDVNRLHVALPSPSIQRVVLHVHVTFVNNQLCFWMKRDNTKVKCFVLAFHGSNVDLLLQRLVYSTLSNRRDMASSSTSYVSSYRCMTESCFVL